MPGPLRIASRGSELALWQARAIEQALRAADPSLAVEIEVVRTTGDTILDVPLARIGDRGLFTKELDQILLAGGAEIAVHSLKDVPTRLPEGLCLAAITERTDPRDVLICRGGLGPSIEALQQGARVGTSSLRRRAQLLAVRPDLQVEDLRGNLNTRLARLDAGQYDAILLAAAGVLRLGWDDRISYFLNPVEWLPAVGQGALAVVVRADAETVIQRLSVLQHQPSASCVTAERAFLAAVEGGCQVPVGALATLEGELLHLSAFVADLDGSNVLRDSEVAPATEPEALGTRLAERLLSRGGREILERVRRAAATSLPGVTAP